MHHYWHTAIDIIAIRMCGNGFEQALTKGGTVPKIHTGRHNYNAIFLFYE